MILRRRATLLWVVVFLGLGCSSAQTPQSLPDARAAITRYVESGNYDRAVADVVAKAERYLDSRADAVEQPAIVLDIDETSLSGWEYLVEQGFCYDEASFRAFVEERDAPPIPPTLALYEKAVRQGVAVFFVTGRREPLRVPTADSLRRAGFEKWEGLYLKPAEGSVDTVEFKSGQRRRIEEKGYTIVLSIGDQRSDLAGGYAERTFLLPNPFYLVP